MIYFQVVAISIETVLVFAIGGVLIHAAFWPTSPVPSKIRQRLGDALIYVAVFIFIGSGVSKFVHVPLAVTEMGLLGLTGPKYFLVASIEITSGILLLIRRVRSFALLFISAHVGGAICAHQIADQNFAMVPSAIVLSLCWLGCVSASSSGSVEFQRGLVERAAATGRMATFAATYSLGFTGALNNERFSSFHHRDRNARRHCWLSPCR